VEGQVNTEVRLAVLENKQDALKIDLDEMKTDLRSIRDTLQQATGGWKTLLLVAGIAGSVGAIAAKVFPWLSIGPR